MERGERRIVGEGRLVVLRLIDEGGGEKRDRSCCTGTAGDLIERCHQNRGHGFTGNMWWNG